MCVMAFILIVIAACAPQKPENEQQASAVTRYVRSGTQGVELKFLQDLPPRQIYDTTDLAAVVEMRNLGNKDLGPNDCFIQFGGFDFNIVRGVQARQSCGDLPGKSEFVLEGGFNTVEIESSNIVLPPDVDQYTPSIVATACYEYKTIAAPQVCVDPSFFELTRDVRACEVRDFGLAGGQGAPMAVTYVNTDMAGSKANFQIDVANVGTGRVVSPQANIAQCPSGLKYDDFDQVRYSVSLPGGQLIRCAPADFMVRLTNNKGKIVCTFDVGNTQARETPLRIELNYNYMQSIRTPVEIVRTPG